MKSNTFGTKTGKEPSGTASLLKINWKRCKGYKAKCGKHINSRPYYSGLRQTYCASCVEKINQEEAEKILAKRNL